MDHYYSAILSSTLFCKNQSDHTLHYLHSGSFSSPSEGLCLRSSQAFQYIAICLLLWVLLVFEMSLCFVDFVRSFVDEVEVRVHFEILVKFNAFCEMSGNFLGD